MGYMHIDNLYKDQTILLFKECYAMEKVDGTSAHVTISSDSESADPEDAVRVQYFSGGAEMLAFLKTLPSKETLISLYNLHINSKAKVTFYGEAYGGKVQGQSKRYGKDLHFIVFDVKIGDCWLNVPQAERLAWDFGFEFVPYAQCSTELWALDGYRDADSTVACLRGMGSGLKREGVVLRPLVEVTLNNGSRVIAKHKRTDFKETKTDREVGKNYEVLQEAQAIAEEWVTPMRLQHVLDALKSGGVDISGPSAIPTVIRAMLEDVGREGRDEYVDSKAARAAISRLAATLFKQHLENALRV